MSRPIDRFLFAAPYPIISTRFSRREEKKTERKRNLSILSPRKFTRAAKRGVSRFGKIERKVLSRGNWIENSRKGTMDTKVHRVPSPPPPLDPFFPLPRCGEKRFDIRTRTVKLSLARVLAFWSGTCQGTAALTERGSPPSQVAVQFYQGAYRS